MKNNKKLDAEKTRKLEFKVYEFKEKFSLINICCHFQIIATETGPNKQSASADVIVNVLDLNDNVPIFDQDEYKYDSLQISQKLTFLLFQS